MRRTRCRLGQRTTNNGISPRHSRLSSRTYTPGGTVVPPPVETFYMLLEGTSDRMIIQGGADLMLQEQ